MNNRYKVTILAIFIAVFAVTMAVSVKAQTTSNGDDEISSVVTSATTSNGGDDIVPSDASAATSNGGDEPVITNTTAITTNGADDYVGTSGSGTGATTAITTNGDDDIIPTGGSSTGGSTSSTTNGDDDFIPTGGSSTGGSTSSTTNGDDDINSTPVVPPVTPPVTPPVITGGGGSFSSGSSSSSSSGGGYTFTAIANPATSTCPLLTTFIKAGANNNAAEVAKLQSFLRASQGSNIAVTGIYNQVTQNAVSAFQSKYMSEVMGPWGATQSSGYVYITTLKKINQLACKSPFILSAGDLAIINAYKARIAAGINGVSPNGSTTGPVLNTGTSTNSGSTSDQIGTNADGSQTAAVGNTSIFARIWNFIVSLFK
jgi:hypothetical protein